MDDEKGVLLKHSSAELDDDGRFKRTGMLSLSFPMCFIVMTSINVYLFLFFVYQILDLGCPQSKYLAAITGVYLMTKIYLAAGYFYYIPIQICNIPCSYVMLVY